MITRELYRYLISLLMFSKNNVVDAVIEYNFNNKSPSELEKKYGIPRNSIRSYHQNFVAKGIRSVSEEELREAVKKIVSELKKRGLITKCNETYCRCPICKDLLDRQYLTLHVILSHRKLIDEIIMAIGG